MPKTQTSPHVINCVISSKLRRPMTDIINAGTNVDVDDTSQYFADYEDVLNMPVVEDQ